MTVTRDKYLAADELDHLRATTQGAAGESAAAALRWLVVDVALQTGLRVNELCRISIGHINLRARTLRVSRSKRKGGLQWETVAMSPSLCGHLAQHMAELGSLHPEQPLFVGKRGPCTVRGLQQAWTRALELAGLPTSVTIHGARHTLAVHLYGATKDLRLVQKQLGHASPETTAEYYADVPFEAQLDALQGVFG